MPVSTLYKSCLQKVPTYLRARIYKSCHENPFSTIPSKIVNDLLSATIDAHQWDGLSADDLELLLTCRRLQRFKIHLNHVNEDHVCHLITQVLCFLKLGCHELKVLHLTWFTTDTQSSELSKAIEDVVSNSPNLKNLLSSYPFDLKTLRNCRNLRSLKLGFMPQQPWYEFLEKENDDFLPHNNLEYFTVSARESARGIPSDDVVFILRHCPVLTSLGEMESLEVLLLLQKMCFPPNKLKLRHCYWKDHSFPSNQSLVNHVRDAVQYYPAIEELDLVAFASIETVSYLKNLRNLVYLNIYFAVYSSGNTGEVFRNALQEIGSGLKHLSFNLWEGPVDVSILLQYCPNLESLRIDCGEEQSFASSFVHLPCLQRLCMMGGWDRDVKLGKLFLQLSGCNQLTDLFLYTNNSFDDKTLYCFLKKNSLQNLKVAALSFFSLTELGFREFLLSAPQLEKIEIDDSPFRINEFKRIASEINHKANLNGNSLSADDEFFAKRPSRIFSSCDV